MVVFASGPPPYEVFTMKKSLLLIRNFSVLLTLTLLIQGCGPRSASDDSREGVFTQQELTADREHLATPLDTSNLSKTEQDYEELRKRESSLAIESVPTPTPSKRPTKKATVPKAVREAALPPRFSYTVAGGLKSAWKKCNLFMNEGGEYGSYGRIITKYIDEGLSEVLLSDRLLGMNDAPHACPNWKSFTNETKKKFWVWTLAAIAADESGCNAYVKDHKDVTGHYTFGLYQLERSNKLRLSNRRFDKHCTHSLNDLRKPLGSIRCAMDMITTQLITRKTTPMEFDGHLYPAPGMEISTYFNDFHHAYGDNIGRLIREFKPCGASEPKR
jgi:hypothetical protein